MQLHLRHWAEWRLAYWILQLRLAKIPSKTEFPLASVHGYSIFDSALYRNLDTEWLFPQEKVALQDIQMSTSESKML